MCFAFDKLNGSLTSYCAGRDGLQAGCTVEGVGLEAFADKDASTRFQPVLNLGTLLNLPDWSAAPRGSAVEVAQAIRAAGYQGVQGTDDPAYRQAGLVTYGAGRVVRAEEAQIVIGKNVDQGHLATTLHVGTGFEDEREALTLIEAVLEASDRLRHPSFIETHRATITQDMWRTLRWVELCPAIRFNADFSHWYTGLEMAYGDFESKLDRLAPVFERVGFIHGRIGNGGSMQVPIGIGGRDEPHTSRFLEMWRRCFSAFLKAGDEKAAIVFAPELLPAVLPRPEGPLYMDYALTRQTDEGGEEELSDRWDQALKLLALARSAFSESARAVPN